MPARHRRPGPLSSCELPRRAHFRPGALRLFGIDAPDVLLPAVGQPQRSMANAYGVAAFAEPLLDDLVGIGIDLRERNLHDRNPDGPFAVRDVAAGARNAQLDVGDVLFRPDVDARHRSVALIERPDRSGASGRKTRLWTNLDTIGDEVGLRVDAS